MKATWTILALPWLLAGLPLVAGPAAPPRMHWADDSSGRPFSKDPSVVRFGGRYLMYYSLPPSSGGGWSIGIAASEDLLDWQRVGAVGPAQACDQRGLAAPAAWVRGGKVHLPPCIVACWDLHNWDWREPGPPWWHARVTGQRSVKARARPLKSRNDLS